MSITINPVLTSNAQGSFNTQTTGYIQGTALDSPSIRNQLAGGLLKSTAALPMWGGVAISENVPGDTPGPQSELGGLVDRATNVTANAASSVTGFSVFDQNHSSINSPQSPVPLAAPSMQVNFYRLGSGARIAVKADPDLVDAQGNVITQQLSWDFTDQRLIPYVPAGAQIAITSLTWAAGIVTVVTASAHPYGVGDDVVIAGAVPVGYNGDVEILTSADNTHFTYALAADPGAETTPGHVNAGGGALNVRILDVQVGNSMTVDYDEDTGFATWDRSGTTAIILI